MLIVLVATLAAGPPDHPPPLLERAQSSPASATDTSELLASSFPLRTTVGSWAEYSIRSRGAQDFRVRFSVVPPALEAGRAWVEVAALGEMGLPFAARLLVRSGGGVERAFLYVLGQAPLELPTEAVPVARGKRQSRKARISRLIAVARREVSVPAGRFDAEEVRAVPRGHALRAWRSERVPLWGLVRAEGARQVVELVAYGQSGARSAFPDLQGNGSESTK